MKVILSNNVTVIGTKIVDNDNELKAILATWSKILYDGNTIKIVGAYPTTMQEILVCPGCGATSVDHDIVIDYEYKATVYAVYYADADDGCVVRGEVKKDSEVDEDTIFAQCQPLARCTACGKSGMKFGEIIVKMDGQS